MKLDVIIGQNIHGSFLRRKPSCRVVLFFDVRTSIISYSPLWVVPKNNESSLL